MAHHQEFKKEAFKGFTATPSLLGLLASATFLSSCATSQPYQAPSARYEGATMAQITPQAGPQSGLQAYPPSPYAAPMMVSPYQAAQETALLEYKQRLDKIEQALLRLDRRMQLIERNEMGRMGESQIQSFAAPLAQAAVPSPLAAAVVQGYAETPEAYASAYQSGIEPVSNRAPDTTIRGSLQAAPHTLGGGRLPSLADPATNVKPLPNTAGQLAVWTVRYEPEKVWPDRDQLPASREVVDALRNNQQVTLVARGPNPTKPEFQERVRALSRYLAKVASLETVPIAAMATPSLDANTIEVLATP